MSGEQIGPYEVLGKLGQGGMGTVYRALDPALRREVAIKVFEEPLGLDPAVREEALARFEREVDALAALRHPHVVGIHGRGLTRAGQPYLVMDLCAGGSLRDVVRERGPLPVDEALRILSALAEALEQAHAQGILHRDLKPGNVLLDERGEARLTDFGLATGDASLTQTGQIMGTPAYMPPEQAAGERGQVGPQSDVYGLAALGYFLLTGTAPFSGGSTIELLARVLHAPPRPPRELRPDLPPALERALLRGLEKTPESRFHSPRALAGALREPAPAGVSPWPWVAAGLLAVGLAAALAAWPHPPTDPAPTRPTTSLPQATPSSPREPEASLGLPPELQDPMGRVTRMWERYEAGDGLPPGPPQALDATIATLNGATQQLPKARRGSVEQALGQAAFLRGSLRCMHDPNVGRDPARALLFGGIPWREEPSVALVDEDALSADYRTALRYLEGGPRSRAALALAQLNWRLTPHDLWRKLLSEKAFDQDPRARYFAAWCLWRELGVASDVQQERCETLLKGALELDPAFWKALLALAWLDRTRAVFATREEAAPWSTRSLRWLKHGLARLEELPEDAWTSEARYCSAGLGMQPGDFGAAEKQLDWLTQNARTTLERRSALALRAELHIRRGRRREPGASAQDGVDREDLRAGVADLLELLAEKYSDDAVIWLRAALRTLGAAPPGDNLASITEALLATGLREEADRLSAPLARRGFPDADDPLPPTEVLIAQDRPQDALTALNETPPGDDWQGHWHLARAHALNALERWDEAAAEAEAAAKDPELAVAAAAARGLALLSRGQPGDRERGLELLRPLGHTGAAAALYLQRAQRLLAQGQAPQALAEVRLALARSPASFASWDLLGQIQEVLAKPRQAKAAREITRALR